MRILRVERIGLLVLLTVSLVTPTACQTSGRDAQVGADPARVQVIVRPLSVQYRPDFLANKKRRKLEVKGRDLELIRQHYHEIVTTKLAEKFQITSTPGPGVVRIDAILVDHELDKRDWRVPGKDVFQSAPGVQLVVFLRNSQTGDVVDVVGVTLRPFGDRLMKRGPGFYWTFMRSVFDGLAIRVQRALEDGVVLSGATATTPSHVLAGR